MSTSPSNLRRAIPASIFLALSLSCFYLMDIPFLIKNFPPPSASGFIQWPGNKLPILQRFHAIPFLDAIFADVTVGFAPSSFGYDDVSRWQMMNFMMDIGVWYMMWLMESARRGNKGTVAYYPAAWETIAQIGGGGVVIPFYYFLHLVFGSSVSLLKREKREVAMRDACIFLPLMLVFHYVPAFGILFDTTLERRHWWTWFWQLFSLRITIAYYAMLAILRFVPLPNPGRRVGYQRSIMLTMAPLIAISAAMWIYTLLNCPHPLASVFFPQPLVEDTWLLRMRRILQFDQMFIYGSSILWLVWLLADMKRAGLVTGSRIVGICIGTVVVTALLGPGAAFGIMWIWRERHLVPKESHDEEDFLAKKR